jgi:serine protease Do
MPDLLDEGRVSRGYLGVNLQPLTPQLAKSFGLDPTGAAPQGALISEVLAGTPAAEAGLRPGDIVLFLDDSPVKSSRELSEAVASLDPGTRAELRILRDGEEREFTVELAERPGRDEIERRVLRGERREPRPYGLRLDALPPALAREHGLEGGVLIRSVEPGSPAERAGLVAGEIILAVGKHDIDSAVEAEERLDETEDGARLLVRDQDGATRWVFLERSAKDD